MLVNYSSSSSEDENDSVTFHRKRRNLINNLSAPPRKRGKPNAETRGADVQPLPRDGSVPKEETASRLPLPASVLGMFRDGEEQMTDESSHHGGRIRSFEHERGNWATYIYLPYFPDDVFLELLDKVMAVARAHDIPLTQAEEFHISLSQTVVLRHHWIQPFVQSLRAAFAQCRQFVCLAERFRVYCNNDKTRTFLGMEVSIGHAQLLDLVHVVDKTMEEFSLNTFYQDPSFHVSLAWCVGDFTEPIKSTCLPKLQNLADTHEDGPFQLRMNCDALRCKTGNKIFSFPLQ